MSLGVNHLGHFLLVQLLLPQMERAKNARCCIVGSVTGNKNTVAGSLVKPIADVGELEGLVAGPGQVMVDGNQKFDGAKAYKDAKALNMMTVLELHRRLSKKTGTTFNSMCAPRRAAASRRAASHRAASHRAAHCAPPPPRLAARPHKTPPAAAPRRRAKTALQPSPCT